MAFVVIGDLSLRDCAVTTAKSARLSAEEILSLARANLLRTQYMLHALVCGTFLDGL